MIKIKSEAVSNKLAQYAEYKNAGKKIFAVSLRCCARGGQRPDPD